MIELSGSHDGCISSVSYIKPQLGERRSMLSNSCISSVSYIKPQLRRLKAFGTVRCISSVSYIKPQHSALFWLEVYVVYRPFPTSNHNLMIPFQIHKRCISSVSYIKPQRDSGCIEFLFVVYRPFPTSNHNILGRIKRKTRLYIVRFLHQTTTALGCFRRQV